MFSKMLMLTKNVHRKNIFCKLLQFDSLLHKMTLQEFFESFCSSGAFGTDSYFIYLHFCWFCQTSSYWSLYIHCKWHQSDLKPLRFTLLKDWWAFRIQYPSCTFQLYQFYTQISLNYHDTTKTSLDWKTEIFLSLTTSVYIWSRRRSPICWGSFMKYLQASSLFGNTSTEHSLCECDPQGIKILHLNVQNYKKCLNCMRH